jgi:hypothetical protein
MMKLKIGQEVRAVVSVLLFTVQLMRVSSFSTHESQLTTSSLLDVPRCTRRHQTTLTKVQLSNGNDENVDGGGILSRRQLFGLSTRTMMSAAIVTSPLAVLPRPSSALEEMAPISKKPFAPVETLLPAVRVKLSIDRALSLTNSLIASSTSITTNNALSIEGQRKSQEMYVETLHQLENILLSPQNYVQSLQLQGVPPKPADLYLQSYKPMKGDLPFQRLFIQSGDVQTWKQLKKNEKEQERSSEVRAALNAYTDALSFTSASYLLNVDKATRSSMVREDKLPDVKQVITSDMGMRYLYRNQVLTAMDDVKAEFEYELRKCQPPSSTDNSSKETQMVVLEADDWMELLNLLDLADKAIDRWFSLIDSEDVKNAYHELRASNDMLRQ